MLLAGLRAEKVVNDCRADTFDLVCGNRNTDARAANQDTLFTFAFGNCVCNLFCIFGIIYRGFGVGAEVLKCNFIILQIFDDFLHQGVTAMITAQCQHIKHSFFSSLFRF